MRGVSKLYGTICVVMFIVLTSFSILGLIDAHGRSELPILIDYNIYDGGGNEDGYSIAECSDGGVVVVGSKDNNCYIAKFDSTGNIDWEKTFDLSSVGEKLLDVLIDDDGNVVCVGFRRSSNYRDDTVLIKFDVNGNIIWEKVSSDNNRNGFSNIIFESSDSTYMIAGRNGTSDAYGYLYKYNKDGIMIWKKNVAPSNFGWNSLTRITKYDSNRYLLGGYGDGPIGLKDLYVVVTDLDGNVLSRFILGTSYNDYCYGVTSDSNGYIYVSMFTKTNIKYYTTIYKCDYTGNVIWTREFKGASINSYRIYAKNDILYLLGYEEYSNGSANVRIFSLDTSGNVIWELNNSISDVDIIRDFYWYDDYFYVVGHTTQLTDDILYAKYIFDYTPPKVEIIYPHEGMILNKSYVNVVWNGSDDVDIDHYEISDGGLTWINVGQNTQYNFTNLSEGVHTIYVKAYDVAGNIGEASVNFTVDLTPPALYITYPAPDSIVGDNVTLMWNVTDNYMIDHFEVSDGGTLWINVGLSKKYTFTNLSEGPHTLFVKAYDAANNTNKASVNVTVDLTPPSVWIVFPHPGSIISDSTDLVWNITDNFGFDYCEVSDGGSAWINVGKNTSYHFANLSDGKHTLYVRVYDYAGNVGEANVTVIVDNMLPRIYITDPQMYQWLNSTNVVVNWVAGDNVQIDHYEISLNGADWVNVGKNNTYMLYNLREGAHEFYVKVVDGVGNVGMDKIIFYVDVTSPRISIITPALDYLNQTNVTVRWNMSDNFGVYRCYVYDGYWRNIGTSASYIFRNIPEGNFTFIIKVVDYAGNSCIVTKNVTIDLTPPHIEIIILENEKKVKLNVSDAISGIKNILYRIDDGSWIECPLQFNISLLNISNGSHIIYVKAIDIAGNMAIINKSFTLGIQNNTHIPPTPTVYFNWCPIILIILMTAMVLAYILTVVHYNKEIRKLKETYGLSENISMESESKNQGMSIQNKETHNEEK